MSTALRIGLVTARGAVYDCPGSGTPKLTSSSFTTSSDLKFEGFPPAPGNTDARRGGTSEPFGSIKIPTPTNMAAPQPPPRGGGMSLYANLLGPKADSSTSISRAPVVFKQPGAAGETADGSAARKSADPCLSHGATPSRPPTAS